MLIKSYTIEQNINLLKNNICLFFGDNYGLKDDIKRKIRNLNSKSEITILNQEEIIKKDILNIELNNLSLFKKKKIYFIENTNDKILDKILEITKFVKEDKIYLFAAALDKKSKIRNLFEKSKEFAVVACYEDNEMTLRRIIQEKLKNFDGLNPYNINLILESCNMNRMKLNNELEKIEICFIDQKIEAQKLSVLLNQSENEDFNILKDYAFSGNKDRTRKLLDDTLFEDEKASLYINIINQRLAKLSEIYSISKEIGVLKALETIKPPIFWKDKPFFLEQSKRWKPSDLKSFYKLTYDIEKKIKSNSYIKKHLLIKKLVLDICNKANSL